MIWLAHDNSDELTSGTRAELYFPVPGSTFDGREQQFRWYAGTDAEAYRLTLGTERGSNDIYASPDELDPSVLSQAVTRIPLSGETVWVRLFTMLAGVWWHLDYSYTAAEPLTAPAEFLAPLDSETLTDTAKDVAWTAGTGAVTYTLQIGSTLGGVDLRNQTFDANTHMVTVERLPHDGRTLYFQLVTTYADASFEVEEITVTAVTAPSQPGVLVPDPFTTITAASPIVFEWDAIAYCTAFRLQIGTGQPGARNIVDVILEPYVLSYSLSRTAAGETIFVRLWTAVGGVATYYDTWYVLDNIPGGGVSTIYPGLISPNPLNNDVISQNPFTFVWREATGVQATRLRVWPSGREWEMVTVEYAADVTSASIQFNAQPWGDILFVELDTKIGGVWSTIHYEFTVAPQLLIPRITTAGLNGSTWANGTLVQWATSFGYACRFRVWEGTPPLGTILVDTGPTLDGQCVLQGLRANGATLTMTLEYATYDVSGHGPWMECSRLTGSAPGTGGPTQPVITGVVVAATGAQIHDPTPYAPILTIPPTPINLTLTGHGIITLADPRTGSGTLTVTLTLSAPVRFTTFDPLFNPVPPDGGVAATLWISDTPGILTPDQGNGTWALECPAFRPGYGFAANFLPPWDGWGPGACNLVEGTDTVEFVFPLGNIDYTVPRAICLEVNYLSFATLTADGLAAPVAIGPLHWWIYS